MEDCIFALRKLVGALRRGRRGAFDEGKAWKTIAGC